MSKHKHNYKVISYSGLTATFVCKCGMNVIINFTKDENQVIRRLLKEELRASVGVHRVWYSFIRNFKIKGKEQFKFTGYELITKVEKWAKNHKNDVILCACDDSHFMDSLLCLVDHKTKNSYMGTTMVYIPQNGIGTSEAFLYPGHAKGLIAGLGKTLKEFDRSRFKMTYEHKVVAAFLTRIAARLSAGERWDGMFEAKCSNSINKKGK